MIKQQKSPLTRASIIVASVLSTYTIKSIKTDLNKPLAVSIS